MSKEEETRIAREAMDQKGFLPRLERLLLAVDQSAVGRMAARLAGLIAGAQGMPVTILKLDSATGRTGAAEKRPERSTRKRMTSPNMSSRTRPRTWPRRTWPAPSRGCRAARN